MSAYLCGAGLCKSGLSTRVFLALFEAELMREAEVRTSVLYIADALRMTCENTANLSGGQFIRSKLGDILPGFDDAGDAVSGDEIIGRMKKRLSE